LGQGDLPFLRQEHRRSKKEGKETTAMVRRTDAASIRASSLRRGRLLIGALAVGLLLSACGDEAENSAQSVQRAEQYLADGDGSAAVIELKNALQRDPNNGEARLLLGQINLSAGDGAAAESELVKAQAAGMSGIDVELALARARLLVGTYQSVLDQVPADIALDSTKARELYVARGEALIGTQRLDEAAASFERVLSEENIARAHGGLARIAIARRQFETAEQHLKEALALEPETSEWHALEGEALLDQNRYQDALAALE
jgi:Tfp pilus assembly protein PilF